MSAINNNAFTSGFPVAGASAEFPPGSGAAALPQASRRNDSVGPFSRPVSAPFDPGNAGFAAGSSDSGGLGGFANIMNGFISALQNMLSSLAQQFGLAGGASQNPSAPQRYFTTAQANSVGDPHETFNGSSTSGAVNQTWDNMQSHADLLSSDSFSGGYHVSTLATAPNAQGVTLNASAEIALNGGSTTVALKGNGSYSVASSGQNIVLQQGQAVSLGDGESVTLDVDKSLTVNDRNGAGGSISTTLSTNGSGGVDVKNSAAGVDLGGYLVTQGDTPYYPLPAPRYPVQPLQQAPASYEMLPLTGQALPAQNIQL